jgi:hypothetical protein
VEGRKYVVENYVREQCVTLLKSHSHSLSVAISKGAEFKINAQGKYRASSKAMPLVSIRGRRLTRLIKLFYVCVIYSLKHACYRDNAVEDKIYVLLRLKIFISRKATHQGYSYPAVHT